MCQENPPEVSVFADMSQCREKIAVLYLMGLSNRDIAQKLGGKALDVARNLREVKRQWERAARRQQLVMQGRFVEIYNESMAAWHKSQQGKLRTCEEAQNGEVTKVTTRREEGPGNIGFLRMAFGSLKVLRQCADRNAEKKTAAMNREVLEAQVATEQPAGAGVPALAGAETAVVAAEDLPRDPSLQAAPAKAGTPAPAPMPNRAARRKNARAKLRGRAVPFDLNTRTHSEPPGSQLLAVDERASGRSMAEVMASWGWGGER